MDPDKLKQFQNPKYMPEDGKGHNLRAGDLIRLSVRVFRIRPMRTVLTILGISFGIGTVLFLVSLGSGLQFILIGQLATTEDSLISLEAFYPPESDLSITQEDINEIISFEESDEVSPIAEMTGEAHTDSISGLLFIKAIRTNYFRLSGDKPDLGFAFTEEELSAVPSKTALRLLGLPEDESSLGKELFTTVFYPEGEGGEVKIVEVSTPLKIGGIIDDEFQPPFIFIPYNFLEEKPDSYQRIFVKARDIDNVEPLKDKLIEKGFLISAKIDVVNQARKIMTALTVILGIFGVAALIVSAIGMFNTMIIGFLERVFEVGIMKSIGATAKDIRNLFLMESLIMGFLGGLGGIALGILVGEIFNLGVNFLAGQLGGKPIDLFIYPLDFIIFIIISSALVGVMSGFWPAYRAARLSPRQAFLRK